MKDVLTKEELSTFFNACENYMYKTIFMMIYGSGLRVSLPWFFTSTICRKLSEIYGNKFVQKYLQLCKSIII